MCQVLGQRSIRAIIKLNIFDELIKNYQFQLTRRKKKNIKF